MILRACDNPFRVNRAHQLTFRSPDFFWSALLARLEENDGRGALRGAQGSGKTTLLFELATRLGDAGFETSTTLTRLGHEINAWVPAMATPSSRPGVSIELTGRGAAGRDTSTM